MPIYSYMATHMYMEFMTSKHWRHTHTTLHYLSLF